MSDTSSGALGCRPRSDRVCNAALRRDAISGGFILLWWATAAEDGPPDQQQSRSSPAEIQCHANFHLLAGGDDRTVKLNNDGVCRPGNRHNLRQSSRDERPTRGSHYPGFNALFLDAVGAFCSHRGKEERHHPHDDGDNGMIRQQAVATAADSRSADLSHCPSSTNTKQDHLGEGKPIGGWPAEQALLMVYCFCPSLPRLLQRGDHIYLLPESSPIIHLTKTEDLTLLHNKKNKDISFARTQTAKEDLTMVSTGLQMLGTALAILGWIGAIVVCAIPMWRVTAFIGSNIVTSQTIWEGIWMNCVVQSTGQMQCKVYDSMLALSSDLQAARALTIISILVGIMAILLAVAGGKCTNCVEDPASKSKVGVAAGVMFIAAGVLCLIPVCWTAHSIIRDFYSPLTVNAQKRELGAALYIGWGAAAFMLIGGGLLCCNCPPKDEGPYTARYKAAKSDISAPASGKDYV